MQLTILFDGQYWIGIIEQIENQNLFACKHLFGSSPSDIEVMEFVNQNLISLIRNKKTSITLEKELTIPSNPKKRAREASKAVKKTSISTHAQEVLRLEQESKKKESKVINKEKREEFEEIKFQIKQNKKKEKHKGR